MSAATIRAARRSDVPTILGFVRQLADFERLSHLCVATAEQFDEALFGTRPCAEAWMAEIGPTTVGYALAFTTFSTFVGRPGLWLEDLYVAPVHRRHGIGTAMLRHVAAIAVERGCGRLEWSVLDWNERAIALYRSLGADLLGDWRINRLTGDALLRVGA
ncbi:MAG: GNAT family N-acetyltransferase, partial [Planctomycetes bacterium]|nr:GNAT family N-acetyltransferase [Planctomycetota bacterium]